jgi:antitoxin MazE
MKARLVAIGNSRGVRIPKTVLEQCEMTEEVEMAVEGQRIILSPLKKNKREGWRAAAEKMSIAGDDALIIPDVFEDDVTVD